jgi:redox-sensitive bicupin YhaK (pirin superfamily)
VFILQRVPEEKAGKNRMHVDVHPPLELGVPGLVERLEALGGRRVGAPVTDLLEAIDSWWQVMADPEGNEFCVVADPGHPAPGEPKGTPWHPHRGFETVTYIIDGIFDHHDSFGGGGTITNGDTQWMTAGAGILHIEAPPEHLVVSGGLFHGFQLWVNLPKVDKLMAPAYQDLRSSEVGLVTSADGGSLLRVIAGEVGGVSGPGATHTPMAMVHATVAPGGELNLPWRRDFNALVYVMSGDGFVGPDQTPIGTGQLAVLGHGDALRLSAAPSQQERYAAGLDVVILGGMPIREPVAWAGPFVMNNRAELAQAFEDYQAGRLGQPVPHGDVSGSLR